MWLAKDREGQWIFFVCVCVITIKKMHLIWVSMYESTNWGHYFYVSNWRRDRHFTWSSETREGLAICKIKEVPSFLSYFKTLVLVWSRELNPLPPALQSNALPTELTLPR